MFVTVCLRTALYKRVNALERRRKAKWCHPTIQHEMKAA